MSFDPRATLPAGDAPPMQIEIPGKTAMLLVTLAQELGAKTPGEVIGQALGLLQMVRQAKTRGQRILLRDPDSGREIDLAL
ncbi:MAG: hypothetical protein IPH07_00065 [Deltaproteobacteria bacterium]|nr:hypothetical protein [Deltaproteobacteria bacterium]MBK8238607.1 hypothetical protein [Deltaproteobacteria bacterium]MBK8717435.1 hypothetical protein [Deltaproteobacteria bacterium]MBP7291597.1 hypothetical protein [Nannocystaceae bacterium]